MSQKKETRLGTLNNVRRAQADFFRKEDLEESTVSVWLLVFQREVLNRPP